MVETAHDSVGAFAIEDQPTKSMCSESNDCCSREIVYFQ